MCHVCVSICTCSFLAQRALALQPLMKRERAEEEVTHDGKGEEEQEEQEETAEGEEVKACVQAVQTGRKDQRVTTRYAYTLAAMIPMSDRSVKDQGRAYIHQHNLLMHPFKADYFRYKTWKLRGYTARCDRCADCSYRLRLSARTPQMLAHLSIKDTTCYIEHSGSHGGALNTLRIHMYNANKFGPQASPRKARRLMGHATVSPLY
jgi:hypothetical protein